MHSRGISTACRRLQRLLAGRLPEAALLFRTGWLAKTGKEGLQAQGKHSYAAYKCLLPSLHPGLLLLLRLLAVPFCFLISCLQVTCMSHMDLDTATGNFQVPAKAGTLHPLQQL